ncbi:hypothetical protein [Promicromonospora sp. NPDC023805]|uniref:hypothetical protein n=1 Tax=Promicromonospora sp. NPDC023805 TaxID=3154696 RepID=UPI0033D285ED
MAKAIVPMMIARCTVLLRVMLPIPPDGPRTAGRRCRDIVLHRVKGRNTSRDVRDTEGDVCSDQELLVELRGVSSMGSAMGNSPEK